MAILSETQKLLVIQRLACFYNVAEIVRELKESHGVDASLSQISFYDPNTVNGSRELSQQWKDIYAETRAKFLSDVTAIPIANQAYRLRRLQQIIDSPMVLKNPKMVADVLKQAAEEMGGAYTNKRELSGPDGQPIEYRITDEERAERVAALLNSARARRDGSTDPSAETPETL